MRFLSPLPVRRAAVARAFARAVGTAVLGVTLAGCAFITGVPSISRVELSVPVTVIAPGQSMQATGRAFGRNDNVVNHSKRQVRFSSTDEAVATVNSVTGVIVGVAPGRTRIRATSDDKRDEVELTVRPVPVRQVIINNRDPLVRLAPGAVLLLSAAIIDTNNQPLSNRPPTWRSLDPAVATITAVGAVSPVAVGTTQIVAAVDTGLAPNVRQVADTVTLRVRVVATASVSVTPNQQVTLYTGQQLQFAATITDAGQRPLTDRRAVWSTDNRTALAIDSVTGLANALGPAAGTVEVSARVEVEPGFPTLGILRATVNVAVLDPASSVRVTSSGFPTTTLTLRTGATASLIYTALNARGGALGNRTFRVTSSDEAVVPAAGGTDVNVNRGVITAGATVGTATLTIQALDVRGEPQGTAATLTVTVNP